MEDRFRFRAWNLEKGIMHYNAEDTYDGISENGIEHSNFSALLEDNEYIVMQSTGLKDRNGKLIYEGDIIKYICGGETTIGSLEIDRFNLLTFTNMITCAFCEDWTEIVKAVFFAGDAQIEVIGNIYENKELLKEQK